MGKILYKQLQDKEWLTDQYVVQGKTMARIASEVGTHACVVLDALRRFQIKPRKAHGHFKGVRFSAEHRSRISRALAGKPKEWNRGVKNPNWQGGRTSAVQMERSTTRYKAWKDQVFNRDVFCVNCGSTKNRVAHHIKFYQEFPELRFDVSNGVVLCRSCHSKYHLSLASNGFNSANAPLG